MAQSGSVEIVNLFARTIRIMSEGELLQLEKAWDLELSKSEYFKIINCKTAELIASSCEAAAVLNEDNESYKKALSGFREKYRPGFSDSR